ncbi:Bifunctional ligase/repressor BirA [Nocardioides dokdonensis FR1436]|uniref:Bifunctional ligase/repressor BirA n=1 Tax=Nocardioides dokdonensis FR1436 TaxID=1300347 RepID=A0A1A9GK87_9ACTN|nr:YafY family protein [Nocardioides dokdonensis]ANH38698.1 Bifunctional ligase/repressor BirA [Nocardioides dokdonensis FR1436]
MTEPSSGPTERILRLLALLQQRHTWSGSELAERLGATTRTIRRDVDRLRELGYPVNATQGVAGGYRLGAGRALPPLLLDDAEAVAVAVSLRLAAGGTVAGASEAALRALTKLDQVLPSRLRQRVHGIHDSISTLPGGPAAETVDADALVEIAGACRDLVRLEFAYADRSGATTQRRVEPYGLVATGRRWYLMAYDLDREDWRTFRLDRLREVRVSTWRFTAREHEDPVTYVHRAVTSAPYPHQVLVRFHASAEEVRAVYPVAAVTVEHETDVTSLLRTGGEDLAMVAVYLGLAGYDFEVLEPPGLVEHCAVIGRRFERAGR